ncbi:peptidoglycan endopeptidase [Deinococcus rubellus]|uniref:Peptidoglycan endopeptidase n=1 Tax=Deinococcus rubellus TaxID=1889240 RepID=A0ABY5YMH6_9DEIO|nr:LysM peptidoglycan-binding domain-containing C40 family peptidase [Deinococcus rubellus]UWX65307.1 peptidoglycan endopeptidase [Deinococcus rubellus]
MNAFRMFLTVVALSGSLGTAAAATYTVRAGDTISSVAQRNNLQPQKLMQINGLNTTTLQVGQKLNLGSGTSSRPATAVSAPRSGGSSTIRTAALRFLGIRYASGGSSNWGLDCSGYTQAVYRSMGVSLPRTAASQFHSGSAVGRSNLQAGDLMFFNTMGRGVSHVAIYLGNGDFANANSYYGRTMVDNLSNPYWSARYIGARRVM